MKLLHRFPSFQRGIITIFGTEMSFDCQQRTNLRCISHVTSRTHTHIPYHLHLHHHIRQHHPAAQETHSLQMVHWMALPYDGGTRSLVCVMFFFLFPLQPICTVDLAGPSSPRSPRCSSPADNSPLSPLATIPRRRGSLVTLSPRGEVLVSPVSSPVANVLMSPRKTMNFQELTEESLV
jgi:hypothetical protein